MSDFNRKLVTLILPITFQQFMLAFVSASDALMLGIVSQNSLSSVSLAGQITFVENLFLSAISTGLSIFAAQYWGKNDRKSVEFIFAYVLKITSLVAFFFFLTSFLAPDKLMYIFTKEKELIDGGAIYLKYVSLSFFLVGISQTYITILKNSDKAVKAVIISSTSVVINIFLNAILIFGLFGFPRMEIAGAAVATVIARIIEVIWCLVETTKKDRIKLRLSNLLDNENLLRKDFWKYTFPILGNQMTWGIGFTMYSVIMGHLGTDAVASNSIATIIKNLVVCFCIGISNGGAIMVGNELGAGRLEMAKEYGHRLAIIAIVYGIIAGIMMILISPFILKNINLSPDANHYLKWMIIICSTYMVGKSVNTTTIAGIFCAGGDSKFGLICDTITMWGFSVPLGFFAAFVLEAPVLVVYSLINLDEIVKLPAVYKHYKKYLWVKDLTKSRESIIEV